MPVRKVLDIGNCGPDHASLERLLTTAFQVNFLQAEQLSDALPILKESDVSLILVNRKLDIDYSDGIEVIKALKANPATAKVPVMMITNYDEHQREAVAAGAELGFGKLQFREASTVEKLAKYLERAEPK